MRPPKEKLEPYVNDRESAVEKFGVSDRTVFRWMQHYGIATRKNNKGCNKLNMSKAKEIRKKHSEKVTMKELAEEYGVTFSTISRIVHNVNYKEVREVSKVNIIFNL